MITQIDIEEGGENICYICKNEVPLIEERYVISCVRRNDQRYSPRIVFHTECLKNVAGENYIFEPSL